MFTYILERNLSYIIKTITKLAEWNTCDSQEKPMYFMISRLNKFTIDDVVDIRNKTIQNRIANETRKC